MKTKGCSGNQFALDLAKDKGRMDDEEVIAHGMLAKHDLEEKKKMLIVHRRKSLD